MKEIHTGKWAYGTNGERYYGECDTREIAIEEFKGDFPDYESGYVGSCIKCEFTKYDCDNFADNILEMMDENLGDRCGEYSEDWLESISAEQTKELNLELSQVIINWLDRNNLQPSTYMIEDGEEFEVIESSL